MSFWELVFNDFLAIFILLTIGLFLYSKAKGISMKAILMDLNSLTIFKDLKLLTIASKSPTKPPSALVIARSSPKALTNLKTYWVLGAAIDNVDMNGKVISFNKAICIIINNQEKLKRALL